MRFFTCLILSLAISASAFAQGVSVTGTVADPAGAPIFGVTVTVEGNASLGTTTDANGNYQITVPGRQSILNFSYIGYNEVSQAVGERVQINVTMTEAVDVLDEVVVIGYGTVRRRDLTGSVASVSGSDLAAQPVSNVTQALQGKMPGVSVVQSDGRPGATIRIRVRGGGSITQSNDPLFIVDGFPVSDINDIPADQIESIDVLKDASSTAIYGARGANGVVLVTTKTAKTESLKITYDGYAQIKTPGKVKEMLNPYEYVLANWEFTSLFDLPAADAWARGMGIGQYSNWSSGGVNISNPGGIDSYRNIKHSSVEEDLMRDAISHSHGLTLSGNSGNTRYLVSFNYVDDEGIRIESRYKRANVSAKLSQQIVKGLNFDFDARYTNRVSLGSNRDFGNAAGSQITRASRFIQFDPLGDMSEANTGLGMYRGYIDQTYNPVTILRDQYRESTFDAVRANAALAWEIIPRLRLRSELGIGKNWSESYTFLGLAGGRSFNEATINRNSSNDLRVVNTLNYTFANLKDMNLDVMIGQEASRSDGMSSRMQAQGFPEAFTYKKAYAMFSLYDPNRQLTISNATNYPERSLSWFGRVNYSFKDRYLLTATLRADGSSKFPPGNQWGYFPAAALAWRISEENFLKNVEWLDNLKLRLSYGEAGNDRINPGLWAFNWQSITGNAGRWAGNDVAWPGYVPAVSEMPNKNLKWEITVTRNVGLDFNLFNSRLNGTIDFYSNTTKDLLMRNALPSFSGYSQTMENIGSVRNQGVEVGLSGDIIRKKDLRLSANFNISFNRNKVIELGNEIPPYSSSWASNSTFPQEYILQEGKPVGLIQGYVHDGFYTTDDFTYDPATKKYTLKPDVANSFGIVNGRPTGGVYPGMLKLKNLVGDNNTVDVNDVTVIGNTNPDHTGGFGLNGQWKNFDFMAGFNWSYGNDVLNVEKMLNSFGFKTEQLFHNWNANFEDRYRLFDVQNGQLVRVEDPAALDALNRNAKTYYPYHENGVTTTEAIEDGSFLRLNNITVGYTLPKNISAKVGMQRLRVYATVYNVWVWTKYSGYDPEVDNGMDWGGNYPITGLDAGSYPRSRTYTIGLNITF